MSRFKTKTRARVGVAVVASLALALSACGGSSDSADTPAAESPAVEESAAEVVEEAAEAQADVINNTGSIGRLTLQVAS